MTRQSCSKVLRVLLLILVLSFNLLDAPGLSHTEIEGQIIGLKTKSLLVLTPEIIDNLETYGHQEALTQEQLSFLIEELNQNFRLREEAGETVMDPSSYYGTTFITESCYEAPELNDNNGKAPQFLLNQQIDIFNQQLADGFVRFQPSFRVGIEIRRLIVVKDTVITPSSWGPEYLDINKHLLDSDGVHTINEPFIDIATRHYFAHQLLRLADEYYSDFFPNASSTAILDNNQVPPPWHFYLSRYRNDLTNSIMNLGGDGFNKHQILQLVRRQERGTTHDFPTNLAEAWGFPYEVPDEITFDFGSNLKAAEVKIYITDDSGSLRETPVFSGYSNVEGKVLIGNLYTNVRKSSDAWLSNIILGPYGSLLVVVTKSNQEVLARFVDPRDINLAFWGVGKKATLKMNLGTTEIFPTDLDWTIETKRINTSYMPIITLIDKP